MQLRGYGDVALVRTRGSVIVIVMISNQYWTSTTMDTFIPSHNSINIFGSHQNWNISVFMTMHVVSLTVKSGKNFMIANQCLVQGVKG